MQTKEKQGSRQGHIRIKGFFFPLVPRGSSSPFFSKVLLFLIWVEWCGAVDWVVMDAVLLAVRSISLPSWLRKPLYRRCGNGERAVVDGVVGGKAGTSAVAFQLFARTRMGCSLLYHLFDSSGFFSSKMIDSLLAETGFRPAILI